ncbi:hypothetical protein IAT38_004676 [Cryptococcus sp. DSM 104549]
MSNLNLTKDWLQSVLRPFPSRDLIISEIMSILAERRTLAVKTEAFTFNSGHTALLLLLHGTLPITYRGAIYQIPINIWVPHEYPRAPPLAFVMPTKEMGVRKSREVDPSGRVKEEVVEEWWRGWEKKGIEPLLKHLAGIFSAAPPVYAKPPEAASPAQASSSPAAARSPGPAAAQPQAGQPGQPGHPGQHQPPPPPARPTFVPPNGHADVLPVYRPAPTPPPHPYPQVHPQSPSRQGSTSSYVPQQPGTPPTHPGTPPVPPRVTQRPPHPQSPQSPGPGVPAVPQRPYVPGPLAQQMTGYGSPGGQGVVSPPPQMGLQGFQPQQPPQPQGWSAPQGQQGYVPAPVQGHYHPPPPNGSTPAAVQQPQPVQQPQQPQQVQQSAPQATLAAPRRPVQDLMSSPEISSSDLPDPSTTDPTSPPPLPPSKPPPPSLIHLHSILLPHLTASLPPLLHSLQSTAEHLAARREDLVTGEPAVRDEMARLEAVKKVCDSVGRKMGEVVKQGGERVAELEAKGEVGVDELVCGISIVHNQLIDLVAEDNAIEDTIYHMTRGLDAERVDLDRYLKSIRSLAREQYMKRALIERILQGMGQTGW